jgi:general nucleoside transport system permease protein
VEFVEVVANSGVRLMVPLLLAALGELISERAGVMNVGLEGVMTAGATYVAAVLGLDIPSAVLIAGACGLLAGSLMALGAVWMRGNAILVGFALFILIPGLANFLFVQAKLNAATPALGDISIPYLSKIPVLGAAFFSQNFFYYLAVVLTVLVWAMFAYTRTGLMLSAVGHNPAKAETIGISPRNVQTFALLACGAFAGLGGAALSLGAVGSYVPNIIGGRGFIVIAIVILGRWSVLGAAAGALLMGVLDALKLNLPQISDIPIHLLGALPWIVVVLMLIVSARMRSNAPRTLVT